MLRRLGGCAVALALLLPAQAVTAQAAPAADQRAAATTKTRQVKLGHKPVRATTAHKVRLTFKGRKGQLLNLARVDATEQCGGRVLRRGGKVVKPWAQGYWRLPRTGAYTAINKPCRNQDKTKIRLQVRKVVREDRLLDGASVAVGRSTRVTHLVPFRVGVDERVSLGGGGRLALIRPDRSTTRDVAPGEPGFAVPDASGASGVDAASRSGRYFVEVEPGTRVSLAATTVRTVGVDGPATVVPAGRYARLSFTGTAGQWVYAEITSATTGQPAYQHRLYNVAPAGQSGPAEYFLPAVPVECPGSPGSCLVTQLPAAGSYVVSLPITPGDTTDVSVRVRSAARALPATVDGPAVTYTVPTPGQWVVGELPELPRQESGGSGATVTLSNATGPLGDWRARTVSGYGPCNPSVDMVRCFGIHEPPNAFTMSPTTLTSPAPWDAFANASVAILAVPPGATGSLDLSVTRSAEQQ
ncbi:hypothetical protein ACNKF0_21600 [Nocardioides sp. T5]|uniref:hypothetical protein n=1 Tax=Nocardioides sp. T5 TaxID=3400182 RepID=UPI003A83AA20